MNAITTTNQSELIVTKPQPLDRNPALVYLAGLGSERSRTTQRQALEVVAGLLTGSPDILTCNWAALRFQHTQAIRARLAERYKAATANRVLSALRCVLGAAFDLEQMKAEPYMRAIRVKNIKGFTVPAGRELTYGELEALARACANDPTPAGARDNAILAIMYTVGLRRAEVVTLDLEDYDQESGRLLVNGKGNKQRIDYVKNSTKEALADWLAIRGDEPGPLFLAINKAGWIREGRLSNQMVYNMLVKRGKEAGVKDFSPHDLRRSFATHHFKAKTPITTIRDMMGHASVVTTARYDRSGEEAKEAAAENLHYPNYRGRR